MLAIHSDDKGAVVPPKLAALQIVLVPIVNDESKEAVLAEARKLMGKLEKKFRARLDDRDHLTPGRKFNEWELKGVPLRVELGPRDLKEKQAVLVRRDTGTKRTVRVDSLVEEAEAELEAIQASLLTRATEALEKNTHVASTLSELKKVAGEKGGIVRVPWCGKAECESKMKAEAGGKILNVPLDQKAHGLKCAVCGEGNASVANFGKSY